MTSFNFRTKILIAEDEKVVRTIIRNMLNKLGYKFVDEVEDGEKAWRKLLDNQILKSVRPVYELVLCDLHMPNMTGIDFLKKVRNDERFKNIAFMMITSDTEQKKVVAAATIGIDDYLAKPVTEDKLRLGLSKAYEKFAERQRRTSSATEKVFVQK